MNRSPWWAWWDWPTRRKAYFFAWLLWLLLLIGAMQKSDVWPF